MKSFLIRILKGALIGSGFIVPGVSGGTLSVVFGVYERLISFLANIKENFKENIKYFIPIALGGLIGVVIFSRAVSFLLGEYYDIILWFFVGCIVGTLPSLWKESGKKGRDKKHIIILVLSLAFGLILLNYGSSLIGDKVDPSFPAWIICGMLIALGTLIPGLSPSNFIVYMGLYKDMADGFKSLDFSVIIPIALGGLLTLVLFIKIIENVYNKHYTSFFHFILGVVIASTIVIVPKDYSAFTGKDYGFSALLFLLGIALSMWMARLEDGEKNEVQGL